MFVVKKKYVRHYSIVFDLPNFWLASVTRAEVLEGVINSIHDKFHANSKFNKRIKNYNYTTKNQVQLTDIVGSF